VNDAFLAGLLGAFRRYHEHHGTPVDLMPIGIPVSLRTSDDQAARALASRCTGVRTTPAVGGGFDVWADAAALDAFVIALGRAGVAVRALERRTRSLESLFLELTAPADLGAAGAIGAPRPTDEPDWELAS